jgi:hypothetical protein
MIERRSPGNDDSGARHPDVEPQEPIRLRCRFSPGRDRTATEILGVPYDDYQGPLTVDPTPVGPTLPLGPTWACDLGVARSYAEEVTRVLLHPPYEVAFSDYDHIMVFAPFGAAVSGTVSSTTS